MFKLSAVGFEERYVLLIAERVKLAKI